MYIAIKQQENNLTFKMILRIYRYIERKQLLDTLKI